jgi:hypothetical protein
MDSIGGIEQNDHVIEKGEPPGKAKIRLGNTPEDSSWPKDEYLGDEAARYMHRKASERLQQSRERMLGPMPNHSGEAPPFRPSRLRRYRALLELKAAALIERGTIDIVTNGEPIHAWLTMFSDGTGVFEYLYSASYGEGSGMTRVEKNSLTVEAVGSYLEKALLGSRVRPIAGQEI